MAEHTVDRDRLHDAINMCAANKLYAWSNPLTEPLKINSIGILHEGEIQFPLEEERIKELCTQLAHTRRPLETGPIIVDQTHLYEPKSNQIPFRHVLKELATEAVQETFNINQSHFSFNIDAVLDRLVICSGDELYRGIFNLAKQPGTFGTLLIQIPVAGVIGGSSIMVQYGQESIFMQLDGYSDSKYYVTVIAGKRMQISLPSMLSTSGRQDFTVKAANQSPCVILVAHLVWTDTVHTEPVIESDRFPQFVEGAYQAKRALIGWRTPTEITDEVPWVNTNALNPTGHYFVQSNITNKLPPLDARQIRSLCIPLRHNYCLEALRIESLVDDDALIYKILSSINYLDVELVLFRRADVPSIDWREAARMKIESKVQIFKRCPIQGIQPLISLSVNINRNFAGDPQGGITCASIGPGIEKCTTCTGNNQSNGPFYAAFLIRAKNIDCNEKEQPPVPLNHSSSTVEQNEVSIEEIQSLVDDLEATQDVSKAVTKLKNITDNKTWQTFLARLVKKPIHRTFHVVRSLCLAFYRTKNQEATKKSLAVLARLFFQALITKQGPVYLTGLMESFETCCNTPENMANAVQWAFEPMSAAEIADLIIQSHGANDSGKYLKFIGKEMPKKNFKGVTPSQMMQLLKIYTHLLEMETVKQLWVKLFSDDQSKENRLFLSMLVAPKESTERESFVSLLADHAAIMEDALNSAVTSIDGNVSPQELEELFHLLVSSRSYEKLKSTHRIRLFLGVFSHVDLKTACRLLELLRNDALKTRPVAVNLYMFLMMKLMEVHFLTVAEQSPLETVNEFVGSALWLQHDELNAYLIKDIALNERRSIRCFSSPVLRKFVASFLGGTEKIAEKHAVVIVKLWLEYLATSAEKATVNGPLLAGTFFFCFPTASSERRPDLTGAFAELVDRCTPEAVVALIVEVHERNSEYSVGHDGNRSPSLRFLTTVCEKFIARVIPILSTVDVEKIEVLADAVTKLNDGLLSPDLIHNFMEQDECFGGQVFEKEDDWTVKDAVVQSNGKLEKFLRSNSQRQIFGRLYKSRDCAFRLGTHLIRSSPSPLLMEVKQDGKFFFVEIAKMGQETWAIDDAEVCSNRQLEKFLRSSSELHRFPARPLREARQAEGFGNSLVAMSPWPISFELVQADDGFYCDIRKTRKRMVSLKEMPAAVPVRSTVPKVPPPCNPICYSGSNFSQFSFPYSNFNPGTAFNIANSIMPPRFLNPFQPLYFQNLWNEGPQIKRTKYV